MDLCERPDKRALDELRVVSFEKNVAPKAVASVLVSFGDTQVICAVNCEKRVPAWMQGYGSQSGWLSCEYSMLPYATGVRKARDKIRPDGRGVEIQRLIGRCLRSVADLSKIVGYTLWVDCDVLQADGGTRTAAISGAYVAASLASRQLLRDGVATGPLFKHHLAGVSVGIYEGLKVLDLSYQEDVGASVDMNVAMTGNGQIVEVQATAEQEPLARESFDALLKLAEVGISEIVREQEAVLKD